MRILISTPYLPNSQNGNSVSGRRIRNIFSKLGHEAKLRSVSELTKTIPAADLLLALNAKKSSNIPSRFKQQNPDKILAVLLTGTDLHLHLDQRTPEAVIVIENMSIADAIVVAQPASLASIPNEFSDKTFVVPKSMDFDVLEYCPTPNDKPLSVVSAFHFRELKNPDQLVRIAMQTGAELNLNFFGRVGNSNEEQLFLERTSENENLSWHGELRRIEFLKRLAEAHVFLNTSLVEGGSNAVLEAMQIGVPVLATKIAGNIGMLGEDYPGYFEPDNDNELLALLEKCKNKSFRGELSSFIKNQTSRFSYACEKNAWQDLINQFA